MHHHDQFDRQSNRPRSSTLHPLVFKLILALTALLVIASWAFVGGGYGAFSFVVVTAFAVITVGLTLALYRIWSHHPHGRAPRFSDWAHGEMELWQGRTKASSAATIALLPIAAVAIGMVLFAIVHHIAVG
jgi:hypothetical protein